MGLYDTPSPPDPRETADAQFNYDTGSALASGIINNPNTVDPYGSTTYRQTGTETVTLPDGRRVSVPRYTQTTQLNPVGQNLFNQQQAIAGQSFRRLSPMMDRDSRYGLPGYQFGYESGPNMEFGFSGDTGSESFDNREIRALMNQSPVAGQSFNPLMNQTNLNSFNGLINATGNAADAVPVFDENAFSNDRARVENAVMARGSDLISESRDAQNARLAAQGIMPGTERFSLANANQDRQMNDLAMQAILAGGGEQSRLLGEGRAQRDELAGLRNQQASFTGAENQRLMDQFGMRSGLIGSENARLMAEAGFNNDASQSQFAMRTALTQMENARRAGDMNAYNMALQAYNNASLAQTQTNRDAANFTNAARSQALNEAEALKSNELNRLIGILSGAQVQSPTVPQYATQGITAPNYSGLVQNNYEQQIASQNAMLGALAGLGGSAFKAIPFG